MQAPVEQAGIDAAWDRWKIGTILESSLEFQYFIFSELVKSFSSLSRRLGESPPEARVCFAAPSNSNPRWTDYRLWRYSFSATMGNHIVHPSTNPRRRFQYGQHAQTFILFISH